MPLFSDPACYEGLVRSAELSECRRYRYCLTRRWRQGGDGRTVCFVMLNPSTADGLADDPTVRRCMGYVKRWGASVLRVMNLFAWRATRPRDLLKVGQPVGPQNYFYLREAAGADLVVAAWGGWVPFGRDWEVRKLLDDVPVFCLGKTKSGMPRHPLFARADAELVPFNAAAEAGR